MNGKGDTPRPMSVSKKDFDERFDAIDWEGDPWAEAKNATERFEYHVTHTFQLKNRRPHFVMRL